MNVTEEEKARAERWAQRTAEVKKTRRLVHDVYGVAQSHWPECTIWWDRVDGGFSAEVCVNNKGVFPDDSFVASSGSDALFHLLRKVLTIDEDTFGGTP
jgi:hypothetical protein